MALDGAEVAAVRDSEASAWLDASPELVSSARSLSEQIFALAVRYFPRNPLRRLLTQGFDAEQIWQQIEIQDRQLLSSVRRQIRDLEKLDAAGDFFGLGNAVAEEQENGKAEASDDSLSEEDKETEGEEVSDEEEEEAEAGVSNVLEDKFLKLKDMDRFLLDAEEEYQRGDEAPEKDEEEDDEEDDEDDGADSDDGDKDIRYEDFYGMIKSKEKSQSKDHDKEQEEEPDDDDDDDDEQGEDAEEEDNEEDEGQQEQGGKSERLQEKSSHEKQLEKTQKRIELLEKANMDPKDWTMRGEITAAKRPKNSALEADLDFEHNARPAPIITEEVTTSLEDLIRRRIIDGLFDDVERKQKLPDVPLAQKMEIDESKSTKGLGELYEEEYMQSAGLASAPETEADKLKQEARDVFKRLCIKLDALAHFHFAPKPVIEDMAVKDVPALAMEEVAPVFVSDASMLAPEEMFSGKGAVKDEKELEKGDRKRRRASKKRKYKAQQKAQALPKRPRADDKTEEQLSAAPKKKQTSDFVKSAKVFAELDRQKTQPAAKAKIEKSMQPSSFKL
ncbi:U3 small nucleolar ribonucleoprotein protein MPP10 [Selaginella moellendorffii]|uniref:U3 small nucleolar ribonucleoprotein protein MPP10 n=1 Tax=Selaginella moellendorffii TaxID=88036 RepID=UPI000D1C39CD|nr:U3 small nucleolar ribonucleoprotein protein MPP10 [Selaginella moellendorffii]|eukprot:XP_024544906.1 U3 small nucleolar ribonucleoprotein protein MPP10 [Selaginella moellendorffii]